MELRYSPLFSGSSGNATYVGCNDAQLLVDAGVSGTRIVHEMEAIGADPRALNAILVTHGHNDHIKGIGVLSRRFNLPVYATQATWEEMSGKIGAISDINRRILVPEEDFFIGSINIMPFPTPHDAKGSVGYTFNLFGARLSIATDIGHVTESWMKYVRGSDVVLLESNYDPDMLSAGPYPYDLKQRIRSRHGHLSNEAAGQAAAELIRSGTSQIILGHLSRENNYPALAMLSMERYLESERISPEDCALLIANRDGNTGLFSIESQFEEV